MKIIDLSIPLNNTTPTYPGDPPIHIEQIATIEKQGWAEKAIHLNTHCGTHLDAPSHLLANGKNLDELPLEKFYGKGIVIDVREREINIDCLNGISQNDVVLFLTGQSQKQNYSENAKFIPEEVAHKLVELKVKAIGIDSFSPDTDPFPVHKILLPYNILIIENLRNLDKLPSRNFQIHYFPLKITEGDGAPCRAIAFIEG